MIYGSAFLLGVLCVHGYSNLPNSTYLGVILALGSVLFLLLGIVFSKRRSWIQRFGWVFFSFMLGMLWVTGCVQNRLSYEVPKALINKTLLVGVRVGGLPQLHTDTWRFEGQIETLPSGLTESQKQSLLGAQGQFSLSQKLTPHVQPLPGQLWSFSLKLKPIHGTINPHGFDYESHAFRQNLRFSARVTKPPKLLSHDRFYSFQVAIDSLRDELRKRMQKVLGKREYSSVLIALAMGDQAAVSADKWLLFNRTGITHLVSISGLHVTLVAALGGVLALHVWKRIHWRGIALSDRTPAQVIAAVVALVIAYLYCLLAGWGVPAQRTFFMLAIIAMASMIGLRIRLPWLLMLAAVVITVLDPWAMLAAGFYLSFGAVALLMLASSGRWRIRHYDQHPLADVQTVYDGAGQAALKNKPLWRDRLWHHPRVQALRLAVSLQLMITLALMPMLIYGFNQVSFISPVVNAFAIPWVSLVMTPGVLILMLVSYFDALQPLALLLASLLHAGFELMMKAVIACAAIPYASMDTSAIPPWLLLVAMMGIILWTLPEVFPLQNTALMLLGLCLIWPSYRPQEGEWRMTVLDVGQGGAVVISTRHQNWLFDTGPPLGDQNNLAQRVILPFLRASGVDQLDKVIVSHLDSDHAAGTLSVKEAIPALEWLAPSVLPYEGISTHLCELGQSWDVDGVRFSIVHPDRSLRDSVNTKISENDRGCVLLIEGKYHRALLTGDIGVDQENRLNLGKIDVMTVGHHGSKTSSSRHFIEAHLPGHAIFQVGFLNRYGHPHPHVWERWQDYETMLHRSDWHGAVVATSTAQGLNVERWREKTRRYWRLF